MPGQSIKIRVGASLDSGTLSVFEPLEKAAGKAAGNIAKSLNKGAKAGSGQLVRETKKEGDALDRELERMANKIIKDEEKAQAGRKREVEKAAKERVRLEKAANREIERDLAQHSREKAKAEKESQRQQRNSPSILDKSWWKAQRGQMGIGRRAAIGVSRGTALAYGLAGSAISSGIGAAESYASALGVDTTLAGHVQSAQALHSQSVSIANAGYIPGQAGATGQLQDSNEILKEIQNAGNKTATSFSDMGEGLRKFVGLTGDLETGRETLLDLGKLAKATGANFVDMSAEAAEISNHMGDIPNKGQAVLAVIRAIAGQGKLGAVETKDLAIQMAKLAANAGKFEGGVAKNISDLGVLAQEAKLEGGATSASQAATSVARFASGFATKSTLKHWDAAGINPYTDKSKTTLRSPLELIMESLKYSKGNLPKLAQLFPSQQGIRAVQGFATIYNRTGGSEQDKLRAVVAEFERLKIALLTQEEVTRAFNASMETSQSKVQIANNKLDELAGHLETALLPAIAQLAPAIESMTPAIVGMIDKFASLLGIDVKGDEEKDRVAKSNAAAGAGRQELDAAIAASETGGGKPGYKPKVGAFDPAHLKDLEKKADALNAQAAEEEGKKGANPEAYAGTKLVDVGEGNQAEVASPEGAENAARLKSIHEAADKTNQLLRDIHQAILEGKIALPEPPKAPTTGREPADSDSGDGGSSHM